MIDTSNIQVRMTRRIWSIETYSGEQYVLAVTGGDEDASVRAVWDYLRGKGHIASSWCQLTDQTTARQLRESLVQAEIRVSLGR